MDPMFEQALLLSLCTATISFAVTEAGLFRKVREAAKAWHALAGDLFSCGYCLGHWVAAALVAIFQPRLFHSWWLLDYALTALVIAWLSAFQWILLVWLMQRTGK